MFTLVFNAYSFQQGAKYIEEEIKTKLGMNKKE